MKVGAEGWRGVAWSGQFTARQVRRARKQFFLLFTSYKSIDWPLGFRGRRGIALADELDA